MELDTAHRTAPAPTKACCPTATPPTPFLAHPYSAQSTCCCCCCCFTTAAGSTGSAVVLMLAATPAWTREERLSLSRCAAVIAVACSSQPVAATTATDSFVRCSKSTPATPKGTPPPTHTHTTSDTLPCTRSQLAPGLSQPPQPPQPPQPLSPTKMAGVVWLALPTTNLSLHCTHTHTRRPPTSRGCKHT